MKPALKFGPLAALGAALAVLAGLFVASGAGQSADAFTVDLNTSGNTATSLGAADECLEVNAGDSVTIDITATNIPASTPMIAFGYSLHYNPAAISITAADANFLLASTAGSSVLLAGDETGLPDTDGAFNAAGADTGDVNTTADSGSGVIERVTLQVAQGAAAGAYPLTLSESATVDSQNTAHPPDHLVGARLAVGVTCASLPTPTVAPTNKQGDVDCSGAVNAVDALKVLRSVANLSVAQTEPCNDIGTGSPVQGDVDCSGSVNAVDALKVLRFVAGLTVTQTEPCPDIGT